MSANAAEWEIVTVEQYEWTKTARMAVPGGWIYRVVCWHGEDLRTPQLSLVFVPSVATK